MLMLICVHNIFFVQYFGFLVWHAAPGYYKITEDMELGQSDIYYITEEIKNTAKNLSFYKMVIYLQGISQMFQDVNTSCHDAGGGNIKR